MKLHQFSFLLIINFIVIFTHIIGAETNGTFRHNFKKSKRNLPQSSMEQLVAKPALLDITRTKPFTIYTPQQNILSELSDGDSDNFESPAPTPPLSVRSIAQPPNQSTYRKNCSHFLKKLLCCNFQPLQEDVLVAEQAADKVIHTLEKDAVVAWHDIEKDAQFLKKDIRHDVKKVEHAEHEIKQNLETEAPEIEDFIKDAAPVVETALRLAEVI